MVTKVREFMTDECGQDMAEYSLLLVLLGTIILIYLTGVGTNVITILNRIQATIVITNDSVQ